MKRFLGVALALVLSWGSVAFAADTKISAMTADASPTSDDLVVTVNDPAGVPANRKVTFANLAAFVLANDVEISSIAGLTSAADKVPYYTGSGTASVFTATTYGRSLLNVADEAAFKALINAEAGTDFQAYDADLGTLSTAFSTASGTAAAFLDLAEDTDNGSNRVRLSGAQSTADVTVTLPAATTTLVGTDTTDTLTNKTIDCNSNTCQNFPGGSGAPTDATYIMQTANASTSAEQALSSLSTGLMKVTNGTGVISTAAAGTDYQGVDAELTSIAGLTSAANKLPYYTGSGTAALADFTAAGRSIAGAADAAAQRTALSLGTIAVKDYTETSENTLPTITWTGTTAPSGSSNLVYRAVQVGSMVTLTWRMEYAVAGSTLTKATFDLPAGLPTPASPTGMSANELVWSGTGNLSTSMTGTSSTRVNIYRNSGDTGFEIQMEASSGNYTGGVGSITYFTF
jgi:hypothetical protein